MLTSQVRRLVERYALLQVLHQLDEEDRRRFLTLECLDIGVGMGDGDDGAIQPFGKLRGESPQRQRGLLVAVVGHRLDEHPTQPGLGTQRVRQLVRGHRHGALGFLGDEDLHVFTIQLHRRLQDHAVVFVGCADELRIVTGRVGVMRSWAAASVVSTRPVAGSPTSIELNHPMFCARPPT